MLLIRLLTLTLKFGTLPGDMSLRMKQYYAKPGNQFWEIIYSVYGASKHNKYKDKCMFLLMNKIALWDVLLYADRIGSSDRNIKNEIPNDIIKLLVEYPNIRKIIFNGSTAEVLFKKHFPIEYNTMNCVKVSSTSPTPGKNVKPLDEKMKEWKMALLYK